MKQNPSNPRSSEASKQSKGEFFGNPHHISCPKCGHRSVVSLDENRYVCLHCGWRRDVASGFKPVPVLVFAVAAAILVLLLIG